MAVKRDSVSPVCLVCGPEAFLRAEAVKRLVAAALHGEPQGLGRTTFDGSQASLADVLDEVRTESLLGDPRVVVVENADEFVSEHRTALEKYAGSPSDTGTLILVCASEASTTRLHKAIAARGGVERCELPKNERERRPYFDSWITQRAAQTYGKRISSAVATKLREAVGDSLGMLDQEIEKLATYVGARAEIKAEDLESLVGNYRERNIFEMTDALARGDATAALRLWERVLATDRAAPYRAVGGVAWAIRRRLESGPDRRAEAQLIDLLEADYGNKTGLSGVDRAMERFIVRHSTAAKESRREVHRGMEATGGGGRMR